METAPTILIEVALPPDVVLQQLARYGKDWHESRLPPEVRRAYYQCVVKVQGSSFELRLGLQINDPDLSWRGSVEADERGGSIVTAIPTVKPMSIMALFFGLAVGAGYQLASGESVAHLIPVLGLVLALVLPIVLVYAPRANSKLVERQTPLCRAILMRATQVR